MKQPDRDGKTCVLIVDADEAMRIPHFFDLHEMGFVVL